jgi:dTDP-4-dehydrorhamnose reductase
MKILITGANGQLGYHLKQSFAAHELYLGDTENYDITNAETVDRETEQFQPDLIIHGAAYTYVDGAEANQELCRQINVEGSRNVAKAAKSVGAKMVAISTDYVFAGDSQTPYKETDTPNPLSFYGQTKYEGELAVSETLDQYFICRTSWLYGGPKPSPTNNIDAPYKNFVYTMLRAGRNNDQLAVVSDQVGAPTYAHDLAQTLVQLVATDKYGIYHITNSGTTNWADFAERIFELATYKTIVKHISSQEWATQNPNATKRPGYSVLAHDALKVADLEDVRSWDQAAADFLSEYKGHTHE